MYCQVHTAIVIGIDSVPVQVEADVSDGMPVFDLVGFLGSEVREARERVRTALRNAGYVLPVKRITVNISPASIRKTGTGFDLPIAAAILGAMGVIPGEALSDVLMVGELGLSGVINKTAGVLPILLAARDQKIRCGIVPAGNYREASLVKNLDIIAAANLCDVISFLSDGVIPDPPASAQPDAYDPSDHGEADFRYAQGQAGLRRAAEIAVSGRHNMLMIGPPGAGKTMIARCISSILPPMTERESIELSKIYSVSGLMEERDHLMNRRPFRAPHHTISRAGLTGGGASPKPGEISLAHGGVLFLDELPEFSRSTLEVLRQPLEERRVNIVRQQASVSYPADFMLVAAMNPCPCGYYPDRTRCSCTPSQVRDYMSRISQPLLDRIDICVNAVPLKFTDLVSTNMQEDSDTIRRRVMRVHEIQQKRFRGTDIDYNSRIPVSELERYCPLGEEEKRFMERTFNALGLTARSYHRMLRVARTIADMQESYEIRREHLAEARMYHGIDRSYWDDEAGRSIAWMR